MTRSDYGDDSSFVSYSESTDMPRGHLDQFDVASQRSGPSLDIDKPMTAEEQRLAEQIINEQKIDKDLEEDAATRAALLTSPLLLAASSEVCAPNEYTSYNSKSLKFSSLNESKHDEDLEEDSMDGSINQDDLEFTPRDHTSSHIDFNDPDVFLGEVAKEEEGLSEKKKRMNQVICLVTTVVIILVVVLAVVLVTSGKDERSAKTSTPQPTVSPYPTITPFPSFAPVISLEPTQSPTTSPTTTLPSNKPSATLSSLPTSSPITAIPAEPTGEPTARDDSTFPPTGQPTIPVGDTPQPTSSSSSSSPSASDDEERRAEIEARLIPISGLLALEDESSPQYKAFNWLCKEDPLQLPASDKGIFQRYVLAILYFATDGENWSECASPKGDTPCSNVMKRYLSGAPACRWKGITCDIYEQVEGINLRENGLQGALPQEIGELTELSSLSLSRNRLAGVIPDHLSQLRHLKYLLLNNNEFSGNIPTFIGQLNSIWYVHLGFNRFSGMIPSEMFAPTLQHFDVSDNNLVGAIPPEIYTVSEDLRNIDLSNNKLEGSIPTELGDYPSLRTFAARNNTLTGTLPGEIISDTLETLDVGINSLNGGIPPEVYMFGKSLTFIHLGLNEFAGTIPSRLGDLTSLRTLVLFFNQFSGTIPSDLSKLTRLEVLHLAGNSLQGTMPPDICALRSQSLGKLSSSCGGDNPPVECSCCTYCVTGRRALRATLSKNYQILAPSFTGKKELYAEPPKLNLSI